MVEGVDGTQLARWLASRGLDLAAPLALERLPGGRSNLTFRVEDAHGRQVVLRRPPLSGVLPSAHDMAREHRVQHALADTDVPVARMLGLEEDPEVLGAPFYVMEYVEGHVLRTHEEARALGPAIDAVPDGVVQTLLALHRVDPVAVGLGQGGPEPYVPRQLRAWGRQLEALAAADATRTTELLLLRDRLALDPPPQQATTIVHGDFRLDNVLIGEGGQVRAVLDWELWTLGDPLADLATLVVSWVRPGDPLVQLGLSATTSAALPDPAELISRYAAGSPLDLGRFDHTLAFATWRLAAILEGVLQRFRDGAYGTTARTEWEPLLEVVPALSERVAAALDGGA
jgi:aminoglycoside phosphotransferase (APT) family kinase protein